MNTLENIKVSLQSNPDLNEDIKRKLFGLTEIFHKKLQYYFQKISIFLLYLFGFCYIILIVLFTFTKED